MKNNSFELELLLESLEKLNLLMNERNTELSGNEKALKINYIWS